MVNIASYYAKELASAEDACVFLGCKTPELWLECALAHQETLLIDHAQCEKKAAATALSMINRYSDHTDMVMRMSKLAREELRHFEQVLVIMKKRGIQYSTLSASRYAEGLRQHIRTGRVECLVDTLIIGAFIEARSCERFAALVPLLDTELAKFYQGLLASEARHFLMYLHFAKKIAGESIDKHVERFREIECNLIGTGDEQFRFHSGVPRFFTKAGSLQQ
ncbi:tRNA-(MS[2]IO[6]A)-hydroxylase [Piscirickettsia salmonis]|uniref:tRNA-hydroxylase MiaE n=1 Tax=Piscirickettsia salmonis TaxID=1238 RepID=A0A1L6TB45_PISSA|nr:tRNA-(ms[2]io[6]A)-hydroxylase [Piscirickettsia salmonis]AKP73750.1 tRNA hydroxylase [Piscirickettsia salmonis LF-89 = ATCC VR-1361]ALB22540.1 tRNA-hydroxylase MiaE [Piscirickettsia salmonis]ALY02565.1 tRNA hydroxylase [Piscirickettsia salmonis]AMA42107.1 tRNA hydroxylase [Piscirickettsia salmonis]AOS34583.1 tRNA hydroxylase [Piscirickettsia salmonis]